MSNIVTMFVWTGLFIIPAMVSCVDLEIPGPHFPIAGGAPGDEIVNTGILPKFLSYSATDANAYVQEIGRAGRDGLQSTATLFYNKSDIASNVKGMTDEMRKFVTTSECRRQYLSEHFGFQNSGISPFPFSHQCCDVCENTCDCENCVLKQKHAQKEQNKNKVNQAVKENIRDALVTYFEVENQIIGLPNPSVYTGLSTSLATLISGNYNQYQSVSNIMESFPKLRADSAENISAILNAFL